MRLPWAQSGSSPIDGLVALQQPSPQCCPGGKPATYRRAGQEGLAGNCIVCVGLQKKTNHLTPQTWRIGERKKESTDVVENRPGEELLAGSGLSL